MAFVEVKNISRKGCPTRTPAGLSAQSAGTVIVWSSSTMVTVTVQTFVEEQWSAEASNMPTRAVMVSVKVSSPSAAASAQMLIASRLWDDWPPVRPTLTAAFR